MLCHFRHWKTLKFVYAFASLPEIYIPEKNCYAWNKTRYTNKSKFLCIF